MYRLKELKTRKIQVSVSEKLDGLITKKAEDIGVSKSSLCALILGNYFEQTSKIEQQLHGSDGLIEALKENLLSGLEKK